MKIIFLDFDGVLSTQIVRFSSFEDSCVNNLNEILERSKAHIVVSSSWRKGRSIDQLRDLFLTQGDRCKKIQNPIIINPKLLIDKTPVLNEEEQEEFKLEQNLEPTLFGRGLEISYWLNSAKDKFDIESYLVLDDDVADIAPHVHRHIKTDCYKGLQNKDIQPALDVLNTNILNEEIGLLL